MLASWQRIMNKLNASIPLSYAKIHKASKNIALTCEHKFPLYPMIFAGNYFIFNKSNVNKNFVEVSEINGRRLYCAYYASAEDVKESAELINDNAACCSGTFHDTLKSHYIDYVAPCAIQSYALQVGLHPNYRKNGYIPRYAKLKISRHDISEKKNYLKVFNGNSVAYICFRDLQFEKTDVLCEKLATKDIADNCKVKDMKFNADTKPKEWYNRILCLPFSINKKYQNGTYYRIKKPFSIECKDYHLSNRVVINTTLEFSEYDIDKVLFLYYQDTKRFIYQSPDFQSYLSEPLDEECVQYLGKELRARKVTIARKVEFSYDNNCVYHKLPGFYIIFNDISETTCALVKNDENELRYLGSICKNEMIKVSHEITK